MKKWGCLFLALCRTRQWCWRVLGLAVAGSDPRWSREVSMGVCPQLHFIFCRAWPFKSAGSCCACTAILHHTRMGRESDSSSLLRKSFKAFFSGSKFIGERKVEWDHLWKRSSSRMKRLAGCRRVRETQFLPMAIRKGEREDWVEQKRIKCFEGNKPQV